jgi:ubiquinone/menaquinone biosynthesis C-methylase UbiE
MDPRMSRLQLWEGSTVALSTGSSPAVVEVAPSPARGSESADVLFARESFQSRRRTQQGFEPYTLQWFLEAETIRHSRQGRWMPRILEFARHRGERLLGIGGGLGSDWVQYARNDAEVIVSNSTAHGLGLIQRNFEVRGLKARFVHALPSALPLESSSIDVACLNDLPLEIDYSTVASEVYRVLKPGGKVLAVVRARFDVDFWWRDWLPWGSLLRPISLVAPTDPHRFSARALRRQFGQFAEHRVYKRHLRRAEVPHLMRWLPLPVLERLIGRLLILKAFKPLSAAISVPLAA